MAFIATPVRPHSKAAFRSVVRAQFSPPTSRPSAPLSRRALLAAAAAFAFSNTMSATANTPGLTTEDLVVGTGASFKSGDNIKLHYTLTLGGWESDGGRVVDSSRTRGRPFSYKYDTGSVIKGWDLGVTGMKIGGRRRLIIAPELGYGDAGAGGVIPPKATLFFDIELLGVGY